MSTKEFDIQGHRGCRGLYPENSIPAFLKAIDLGVNTLEMDVVISGDNKVVVSHEPFLSHEICLLPDGQEIHEEEEKALNIYKMPYQELTQYDCGSKRHVRFPDQKKINVYKPLLSDVLDTVQFHLSSNKKRSIAYNIEIKSTAEGDNLFHPAPGVFSELVIDLLKEKQVLSKVTLQSFDIRVLQYIHRHHPNITLAYLVENENGVEKNLDILGFTPDIYSCYFPLLNEQEMKVCRKNNMLVIPWTVNTKEDIEYVLRLEVDGIISDYPERVSELVYTY